MKCLESKKKELETDSVRSVRSFSGDRVHFKLRRTLCQQSLKYI